MIEGVKILSETSVMVWQDQYTTTLLISLFISLISLISFGIFMGIVNTSKYWIIPFIIFLSALFVCGGTIIKAENNKVFSHSLYKVTLSENISAADLLEKYTVVNKDGLIYTIKEIEVDEE